MLGKAFLFLILLSSTGAGLIYSVIAQSGYNEAIDENSQAKVFCWPNQNGLNIVNINGKAGYINQSLNLNYPANLYQSPYMNFKSVSGKKSNEYTSYTINFFNINYGSIQEKSTGHLKKLHLQRYPASLKEALKRSAENARILEKDRKENLELLKRITS
ncbi:MAG: hypothetical protein A4E49_00541 [Methanosaeta sp. PtaU1.Bin112]|nr:MAG: hypothetical protein A4E49_00541 [Methanosaeta sp. PtaU1.Bin112]